MTTWTSAVGAAETPRINTLAGGPGEGAARQVGQDPLFVRPQGQSVLVADGAHQVLRRIDLATQHESVVAGIGGEFLIAQPGRPPLVTPDDGGPAVRAAFHRLGAIATAPDGTIYLADERRIRKISPDGVITTAVGTGARRVSAHPAEARVEDLPLAPVTGLAVDSQGRLWFAEDRIDASGATIRRLDTDGVARLVIGYGTSSLDGAPGRQHRLQQAKGMFFDSVGTLVLLDVSEYSTTVLRYVPDRVQHGHSVNLHVNDMTPAGNGDLLLAVYQQLVRLRPDGSTVREPGTGLLGFSGDYGSVAMLPNGRPVIARHGGYFVTTIDGAGKEVALAGDGSAGAAGDGGPATASQLGRPTSLSRTPDGSVVIADETANRVRRVTPDGRMTTLAGTGTAGNTGDGGPAAEAAIKAPSSVEAAADGSVYVAARNANNAFLIRKISPLGTISTYAGGGNAVEPTADAREQGLSGVEALAIGPDGSLYVNRHCQILKIAPGPTPTSGGVTIVYAGGDYYDPCGDSGDEGPARSARFSTPTGLALSSSGDLYVSDASANRVRRIDAAGTVHAFAGRSYHPGFEKPFAGDSGPATQAHLHRPRGLAVTANNGVLIADEQNYRVRRVSAEGTITTVAGGRYEGLLGDGGPAVGASLNVPRDVESGPDDQLYIAEPGSPAILYTFGRRRVRVVSATAETPEPSNSPASTSGPVSSAAPSAPAPTPSTIMPTPMSPPLAPSTTASPSPAPTSGTGTPTPAAGEATPTTTSASPAPPPTPTPTPTSTRPNEVPSVSVSPFVMRFGQAAYVTISGTPGATVELFIRKYRSDFVKIRKGLVLDERGRATVETRPDMNLRFMAKDPTVAEGSSIGGTSGLVTVEKQVSINVKRVGVNRFTFSGSLNPTHPGAVVHLYRNGKLIKANIPVSSSRVYSFSGRLPTGTANYRITSPGTGYNNVSRSPVRSLRVF